MGHSLHVHRSKYKGVYESPQIHMTKRSANAQRSKFKRTFWKPTDPNLRDIWEGLQIQIDGTLFECPQILNKGLRK